MAWLYLPLLLIAAVYGLYAYFTRTFDYWKKKNVPGPKPVPIFGNIMEFSFRKKSLGDTIKDLYYQFPNEKFIGIFRMTTPAILIRDLDVIKQIMIKDFDVFPDRGIEISKDALGSNLFHADGDTWQVLRNKFTPLFTSGKLKNMLYLLTERVDKFADYVENLVRANPEQEVHKLVQRYTLTTITACAFGLEMDLDESQVKLLQSFEERIFTSSYFFELDMMYPGLLKSLNVPLFGTDVKNFFSNLVKTILHDRNGVPTGRKDFMDLLLELRQQREISGKQRNNDKEELHLELTEDLIAAQAFVFYIAGYETSATTMSFMLYELARNPEIQEKVIAEVDQVLRNHDGKITYDAVNELTYMEQVMNETLRLYPIVDVLQRKAKRDYQIPGTDTVIEKGQMVIVSTLAMHNDAMVFPDPTKFDPERFSTKNFQNLHPCAHIPFGVGPRNCIGMRFAKAQSRVCLIMFFSKFRVEMSKNTPKVMMFDPKRALIGPAEGIRLNIIPRA